MEPRIATPTKFKVGFSGRGTDAVYGEYEEKMLEGPNALKVAFNVVDRTIEMVGPERSAQLQYDLAVILLSVLEYNADLEADLARAREDPEFVAEKWSLNGEERGEEAENGDS